jgi:hypothetical protein
MSVWRIPPMNEVWLFHNFQAAQILVTISNGSSAILCYPLPWESVSLLIFVAMETCVNPWQRFDLHQHIHCSGNLCLPKCCLALDYSGFQASCHSIHIGISVQNAGWVFQRYCITAWSEQWKNERNWWILAKLKRAFCSNVQAVKYSNWNECQQYLKRSFKFKHFIYFVHEAQISSHNPNQACMIFLQHESSIDFNKSLF